MFFIIDVQEEWTWSISNNYIIKSDMCIKLNYIQTSLDYKPLGSGLSPQS